MKVFFLTLCISLALAGLAVAQSTLPQDSLLLAAGPDGGGPGGPGGPGQGQGPEGGNDKIHEGMAKACSGKSAGDDCSVTTPRGDSIAGQCAQDRSGGELVCRPKRGGNQGQGQGQEQGRPGFGGADDQGQGRPGSGGQAGQGQGPEKNRTALAQACSGKSAGDSCTATGPRGDSIAGQCAQDRSGSELICRPTRK